MLWVTLVRAFPFALRIPRIQRTGRASELAWRFLGVGRLRSGASLKLSAHFGSLRGTGIPRRVVTHPATELHHSWRQPAVPGPAWPAANHVAAPTPGKQRRKPQA